MTDQVTPNIYDTLADKADEANAGMRSDEGIQLPFATPLIYWVNGNSQVPFDPANNGVLHFGGWSIQSTVWDSVIKENVIPGFKKVQNTSRRNQQTYEAYYARQISIAPIALRKGWFKDDPSDPAAKAKSHINVLALLGIYDSNAKSYRPWGPVVLYAKSTSSGAVNQSIVDWEQKSYAVRATLSSKTPPSAFWFYFPIGTFGDQINLKEVGKGNQKNWITPCQLYPMDALDADRLNRWFIGPEAVAETGRLRQLAQPWVHDWDKYKGKRDQAGVDQDVVDGFLQQPQDNPFDDPLP